MHNIHGMGFSVTALCSHSKVSFVKYTICLIETIGLLCLKFCRISWVRSTIPKNPTNSHHDTKDTWMGN